MSKNKGHRRPPQRQSAAETNHLFGIEANKLSTSSRFQLGSQGDVFMATATTVTQEGMISMVSTTDKTTGAKGDEIHPKARILRSVKVLNPEFKRAEEVEHIVGYVLARAYEALSGTQFDVRKHEIQDSKTDLFIEGGGRVVEVQVTRAQPSDSWTVKSGDYETISTMQEVVREVFEAVNRKAKDGSRSRVLALDGFVLPLPSIALAKVAAECQPRFRRAGYKEVWYIGPYSELAYRMYPRPKHVPVKRSEADRQWPMSSGTMTGGAAFIKDGKRFPVALDPRVPLIGGGVEMGSSNSVELQSEAEKIGEVK